MAASKHPIKKHDVTISIRDSERIDDIRSRFSGWLEEHAELWVFQLEKTGETNVHIQARCHLKKKVRTMQLVSTLAINCLVDAGHVNCSPTSGSAGNYFDYQMKAETRLEGPFSNKDLSVFDVRDDLEFLPLHPWQEWIERVWFSAEGQNVENPTRRKIVFCVDKKGGAGKSTFVKHCLLKRPKEIAYIPALGNAQQLSSALCQIGPYPYYLVDLPRVKTEETYNDLLYTLETLQSGLVSSTMYGKYTTMLLNPPQVVVFSNSKLPDVLSKDRYIYIYPETFTLRNKINDSKFSEILQDPRIEYGTEQQPLHGPREYELSFTHKGFPLPEELRGENIWEARAECSDDS